MDGAAASGVSASWAGRLGRDLRMLLDGLRGRVPAPYFDRDGAGWRSTGATREAARAVRVLERVVEARDAVSLVLADVTGAGLSWAPGQFFTVLVALDGEEYRRAYSASLPVDAVATPGAVRITVKRVEGGKVSTHLTERVVVGDTLRLLGPSGSFALPKRAHGAVRVMIAGGSGVTPVFAMAMSSLEAEPDARVVLLFGNRSVDDVIFRAALDAMAERFAGRFTLRHVLERAPDGWAGGVGRLDEATLPTELEGALRSAGVGEVDEVEYFVCGPAGMMDAARAVLRAMGVAEGRVHEERFERARPVARPAGEKADARLSPLRLRRGGRTVSGVARGEQTLLDAGLAAGVEMPYSCTMGGCGACRVKLVEGAVDMDEPNCLSASERSEGYVLSCVGRARGAVTLELP